MTKTLYVFINQQDTKYNCPYTGKEHWMPLEVQQLKVWYGSASYYVVRREGIREMEGSCAPD